MAFFTLRPAARTLWCLLAASTAMGSVAPSASALDLPIPVDKVAHFGLSYAVTDQLIRLGASREQAVGATLFGGWLKEVVDRQFDPYDLAADTAGALAAAYLRVEIKF